MKKNLSTRGLFWTLLSLYFIFIGYETLTSEYLLSDEAFMFWHQPDDHLTYKIWVSIGRILSAFLKDWMFGVSKTVADIKYIRFASAIQCFLATLSLSYVLRRLQKKGIAFSDWLIYCTVAFYAASLSSLILIGWAVCTDFFAATILAMFAGLLLYESLLKDGSLLKVRLLLPALMGIVVLFVYQPMYPFMLLPFYGIFLLRKDGRITRTMVAALVFFFVVLGVYYLLFQWSLKATGVSYANRTSLKGFNPLDRLSFFISFPLNQAFLANFFFYARSILSQTIMPVLLTSWVLYTFLSRRGQWKMNLRYLLGMIVWWMLGYLPQLIALESFGPYRTMIVFSLMVFLMMSDLVFTLVKDGQKAKMLTVAAILILLVRGGYVYKCFLADPLSYEYKIVRGFLRDHYTADIREVVFIVAKEDGFGTTFGVSPQKDEFGMPSTFKDWTDEALAKQIVTEMTGTRATAEALKVDVVSDLTAVKDRSLLKDPKVIVIDMPALLRQAPR